MDSELYYYHRHNMPAVHETEIHSDEVVSYKLRVSPQCPNNVISVPPKRHRNHSTIIQRETFMIGP